MKQIELKPVGEEGAVFCVDGREDIHVLNLSAESSDWVARYAGRSVYLVSPRFLTRAEVCAQLERILTPE